MSLETPKYLAQEEVMTCPTAGVPMYIMYTPEDPSVVGAYIGSVPKKKKICVFGVISGTEAVVAPERH